MLQDLDDWMLLMSQHVLNILDINPWTYIRIPGEFVKIADSRVPPNKYSIGIHGVKPGNWYLSNFLKEPHAPF